MDSYAANRHNEDRSQYIEDTLTDPNNGTQTPVFFCACYDGHGGEQAVEFVQRNLYKNIKERLLTGSESTALSIINVCDGLGLCVNVLWTGGLTAIL